MIDEIVLTLEEERKQRVEQLLAMRKKDKKYKLERIEIDNVLEALNQRIAEYSVMFPYSVERIALQTIQDFRAHYVVLQNKKLNVDKPVLVLRDKKNTKVYVNKEMTRAEIKSKSISGGVVVSRPLYFIREEFAGR